MTEKLGYAMGQPNPDCSSNTRGNTNSNKGGVSTKLAAIAQSHSPSRKCSYARFGHTT